MFMLSMVVCNGSDNTAGFKLIAEAGNAVFHNQASRSDGDYSFRVFEVYYIHISTYNTTYL